MTRDRTQLFGAGFALFVLVLLVLLDVTIPPQTAIITALFGLPPLIACAVVPAGGTAGIAILAVLAAALSGVWNDTFGTPQHNVRVINVILVGTAAVTIAAVRVHRERRFVQVSQIAEVAQRAILPVLPERVGHVAIAARYQSAAQGALVGGDLYDCYHADDHVRILIGDVRGKGITGVEQAARVTRAFRQSAPLRATLAEVAEEMNDYLAGFFDDEEFATALLVDVSDPGVIRLVSAGHPGPQLVRSSEARVLDLPIGRMLGLGLPADDSYAEATVPWSPGDRLLVYTDGLSEARDSQGDFFPVESLDDAVRLGSVERAVDEVVGAVRRYIPQGRLEDDLAVVVIGHLPDGVPSTSGRGGADAAIHRVQEDAPLDPRALPFASSPRAGAPVSTPSPVTPRGRGLVSTHG